MSDQSHDYVGSWLVFCDFEDNAHTPSSKVAATL